MHEIKMEDTKEWKSDAAKIVSLSGDRIIRGEMSMILKSGISALEGLELLMEDTQNELEKELINSMYQSMLEGHTFADALEQTHVFPAYLIHMTEVGEETGR